MPQGLLADLVAALLPARCPGCGVRAEPVCRACAAGMRYPKPSPPPLGIDAWVAAFAYEGVARELVARLKYRNARSALPWLAGATADATRRRFGGEGGAGLPDLITWPPTTADRRRERGFDHAELLSRAVGRRLGVPVGATLVRLDRTAQTGRSASERRSGPLFATRAACDGLCVLVVDDVATTGSTLASCASALRRGGAREVVAATVARTLPRRG